MGMCVSDSFFVAKSSAHVQKGQGAVRWNSFLLAKKNGKRDLLPLLLMTTQQRRLATRESKGKRM